MYYARPCRTCGRDIFFEKVTSVNTSHYRPVDAETGIAHHCRRLPRSRHEDIPGQKLLFRDFDRPRRHG